MKIGIDFDGTIAYTNLKKILLKSGSDEKLELPGIEYVRSWEEILKLIL